MNPALSVDLGSGPQPANPFQAERVIGLDAHSIGADVISFWIGFEPLPLETSSVDVVTAFDFLEHLPRAICRNIVVINTFIETMSEVWRILKLQGLFVARMPAFPHPEAFQDPTHVNVITDTTVSYFARRPQADGSVIDAWGPELGGRYGFQGAVVLLGQQWDH